MALRNILNTLTSNPYNKKNNALKFKPPEFTVGKSNSIGIYYIKAIRVNIIRNHMPIYNKKTTKPIAGGPGYGRGHLN